MHEHARDWPVGVEGRDYVVLNFMGERHRELAEHILAAGSGDIIPLRDQFPVLGINGWLYPGDNFEHGAGI